MHSTIATMLLTVLLITPNSVHPEPSQQFCKRTIYAHPQWGTDVRRDCFIYPIR